MIERATSGGVANVKGQVLGYAEEEGLRIAVLDVEDDKVRECEFLKFCSPREVVSYFVERPRPLGIGTPEWLALGTGGEGWRAADYWINEAPFHPRFSHDEFPLQWGPFQLHGGKSLIAIALLCALRRRWPDLPATETAPGECYVHLARSTAWPSLQERIAMLSRWLKAELPASLSEQDWEAAMSAYAMWTGLGGDWPIDLFRLTRPGRTMTVCACSGSAADGTTNSYREPALSYESLIFPAGPVSFFWPPDERAAAPSSRVRVYGRGAMTG